MAMLVMLAGLMATATSVMGTPQVASASLESCSTRPEFPMLVNGPFDLTGDEFFRLNFGSTFLADNASTCSVDTTDLLLQWSNCYFGLLGQTMGVSSTCAEGAPNLQGESFRLFFECSFLSEIFSRVPGGVSTLLSQVCSSGLAVYPGPPAVSTFCAENVGSFSWIKGGQGGGGSVALHVCSLCHSYLPAGCQRMGFTLNGVGI
jgi:hypothetical protein